MTLPAKNKSGYLPTLDGWRAVAILLVIAYHGRDGLVRAIGSVALHLNPVLSYGWFGVHIFFAISGLLITSRLLEEDSMRGAISLRGFYIRRAFRILPPLWLYLAVVFILAVFGVINLPLRDVPRALFFVTNYSPFPDCYVAHTWTLSVEEHFYLFWPLALVLLGPKRGVVFGLLVSLAITIWRFADIHWSIVPARFGFTSWRTDTNLDSILLGAVVGCWMSAPAARERLARYLVPRVTLGLLAALLALFIAWTFSKHLAQPVRIFHAASLPLIVAGTILYPDQVLGRILEAGWIRWIGRLSYSLYLWQQVFFVPDEKRSATLGHLQDWPFNILAAFGCAMLSYYLVERPLIKVGHKLARPVTEGRIDLNNRKGHATPAETPKAVLGTDS